MIKGNTTFTAVRGSFQEMYPDFTELLERMAMDNGMQFRDNSFEIENELIGDLAVIECYLHRIPASEFEDFADLMTVGEEGEKKKFIESATTGLDQDVLTCLDGILNDAFDGRLHHTLFKYPDYLAR